MSNPITDLKHQLLAAAERQYPTVPPQPRRFGGRVVAVRFALVPATVAVAAAVALFLTAPWSSSSPSFVERAEAALTPPEGMILHQKWVQTVISSNPRCTVRFAGELWLDAYAERIGGQRYRAVLRDPFLPYPFKDRQTPLCSRGSEYEVGGIVDGSLIRFVPPKRLVGMPKEAPRLLRGGGSGRASDRGRVSDPVERLRLALRLKEVRDEGKTRRDGRTVERIRFGGGILGGGIAYVDPDTFYPVEIEVSNQPSAAEAAALRRAGVVLHNPRVVTRFALWEYLPRTAANVALTDIRAQHPNAIGG
jgi:hypothetical protein